jgi:hypothetical protein
VEIHSVVVSKRNFLNYEKELVTLTNYRMDNRTKEQFIQDIKKGNERERLAITLFKHYLRREHGFTQDIKENGVDMTGDFIEDERAVNTGADYLVGKAELPLEVKTSAGHSMTIYLKEKQLKSYIRQGASLLYVNGIEEIAAFTFFTVEELKWIVENLTPITPPNNVNGGKLSYKLDARKLEFHTFGGKVRNYARH